MPAARLEDPAAGRLVRSPMRMPLCHILHARLRQQGMVEEATLPAGRKPPPAPRSPSRKPWPPPPARFGATARRHGCAEWFARQTLRAAAWPPSAQGRHCPDNRKRSTPLMNCLPASQLQPVPVAGFFMESHLSLVGQNRISWSAGRCDLERPCRPIGTTDRPYGTFMTCAKPLVRTILVD